MVLLPIGAWFEPFTNSLERSRVVDDRLGLVGPLLDDPLVEEIIIIGGGRTFVVRGGEKELLPEVADRAAVRRLADQLLAGTGRRLDLASPIVSAQLKDGSRLHITGPPVTSEDRLNIQIRRFVMKGGGLDSLVEMGSLPEHAAGQLRAAMRDDATILVAGAPGAGKTTLVNALLSEVSPDRRVVTCEEVFEIQVDLPDLTQMQTRDSGLDGGGEISLRDLVRSSLRQRPDRIVVGEVRGPEAPLHIPDRTRCPFPRGSGRARASCKRRRSSSQMLSDEARREDLVHRAGLSRSVCAVLDGLRIA